MTTPPPEADSSFWAEHSAAAAIAGFLGGALPTDNPRRDVAGALLATTPPEELADEENRTALVHAAAAIAELVVADSPAGPLAKSAGGSAGVAEPPTDFAAGSGGGVLGKALKISRGVAQGTTAAREALMRAWYGVNAYRRVRTAEGLGGKLAALRREPTYYRQHLQASEKRRLNGAEIEAAAATHGIVLGWHSKLLPSTTGECRAAHGKNFRADRPPAIGFPGVVHVGCRCTAGAPWPGAPMLPSGLLAA